MFAKISSNSSNLQKASDILRKFIFARKFPSQLKYVFAELVTKTEFKNEDQQAEIDDSEKTSHDWTDEMGLLLREVLRKNPDCIVEIFTSLSLLSISGRSLINIPLNCRFCLVVISQLPSSPYLATIEAITSS